MAVSGAKIRRDLYRSLKTALIAELFSLSLTPAFAQTPAKPATPPSTSPVGQPAPAPKAPESNLTTIVIQPDKIGGGALQVNEPMGAPLSAPAVETPLLGEGEVRRTPWNHLTFGAYMGLTNAGFFRSWVHMTNDKLLVDHANEFGFTLGFMVDFPMAGEANEGVRVKVGAKKLKFHVPEDVLAANANASLETSATNFAALALYRWGLSSFYRGLWAGAGGGFDYVFSTAREATSISATSASQINHSYGFKPVLAIGADVPLTRLHDISFEFDWIPVRGFSLEAGFRIAL